MNFNPTALPPPNAAAVNAFKKAVAAPTSGGKHRKTRRNVKRGGAIWVGFDIPNLTQETINHAIANSSGMTWQDWLKDTTAMAARGPYSGGTTPDGYWRLIYGLANAADANPDMKRAAAMWFALGAKYYAMMGTWDYPTNELYAMLPAFAAWPNAA